MAKRYLPVDRSQPYLLPPSVQDFVPEDDLAWFLIDAVAAMDTTAFHAKARLGGVGRAGYDPDMLLTLLIYAYCLGQRSSRRIERLCVRDLGFKVVTGNRVVDHSTIAGFRRTHRDAIAGLFTEVLLLCGRSGLRQVGVVAVDGCKFGAAASMEATRQRETLIRERDRLAAQVEAMLTDAADTDAAQDALFGPDRHGDELPAVLRRKADRLARLRETLRQMDQVRAQHDTAGHGPTPTGRPRRADKVAQARRNLDREIARRDEHLAKQAALGPHVRMPGPRPNHEARIAAAQAALDAARAQHPDTDPEPQPDTGLAPQPGTDPEPQPGTDPAPQPGTDLEPHPGTGLVLRPGCSVKHLPHAARYGNVTDPDSRLMKTRRGWKQAYNGQAAAVRVQHGRRLVLAAAVTNDGVDVAQAIPMMQTATTNATRAGLGTPAMFAFDAGYCSEANLTAPGPDRLIALDKNHTRIAELRTNGYRTDDPPPDATPAQTMRHRLNTETGANDYAQRSPTIEPVFGDIKHNRGCTTFHQRGLPAVDAEWKLIHATGNLRVLHRHLHTPNPATPANHPRRKTNPQQPKPTEET